MVTPYLSQQPVDDFGLRFSDLKYSANLPATTDVVLVVPGNAQRYKAVMKSFPVLADVWVAINKSLIIAAELPVGATLIPTNSELLSGMQFCREVVAGDVLHFITPNAGTPLSVVFYALNTNN